MSLKFKRPRQSLRTQPRSDDAISKAHKLTAAAAATAVTTGLVVKALAGGGDAAPEPTTCDSFGAGSSGSTQTLSPSQSPLPTQQVKELPASEGVFVPQGYPTAFKFKKREGAAGYDVTGFQLTQSSRLEMFEGTLLPPGADGTWKLMEHWEDDGETFTELHSEFEYKPATKQFVEAWSSGTRITYDLRKESDLPEATITEDLPGTVDDWTVAKEGFLGYSASWDTRGWDYHKLEPLLNKLDAKVEKSPTEETLLEALRELVAATLDGHTTVWAEVNGKEVDFEGGPARPSNSDWLYDDGAKLTAATKNYTKLETLDEEGYFRVGSLRDGKVGYVAIDSMEGFADDETDNEVKAFNKLLDNAFARFQKSDAVIIDLRQNTGGYDSVGRAIAERLATEPRVSYTKQARDPDLDGSDPCNDGEFDKFTERYDVMLTPKGEVRLPPGTKIIVLTSDITVSAAEIAALHLLGLPGVEFIGERTAGALSDMQDFETPNGVEITLSNERYLTPDGVNYELEGLPVLKEVALDEALIRKGTDNVLEAALAHIDAAKDGGSKPPPKNK